MLTNSNRFTRDSHFEQLEPVYDVTAQEIEGYIKELFALICLHESTNELFCTNRFM